MNSQAEKKSPYLILLVGVLSISTAAILIRFALPSASTVSIAFHRMFFSAIIAILIYLSKGPDKSQKIGRRELGLLILSGSFLALHFTAWTMSLDMVSVSSSVIFVTTTPLWVGLLSPLILKEKVPYRFYVGVVFAMLGGVIIALLPSNGANTRDSLPGLFLALLGAWMASGYLLVNKKLSEKFSTERYIAIIYSVAALILAVIYLLNESPLRTEEPRMYLLFLLMALIPQTLGHTSFNQALRYFPTRTVSLALLFEPVGSSILAIFLLNEIPSVTEIAGGIFILLGLVFALRGKPNEA